MTTSKTVESPEGRASAGTACSAAFTPGPWKVIKPGHGHASEYRCVQIGSDDSYTTLEMLPRDARLIAAAPDLFETCLGLIRSIDGAAKVSPHQLCAIAAAEKALRKAGAKIRLREWERG